MSQVIIRRKANQSIPEDFFQLCPKKVWGIAILADGILERMQGENIDLEALRSTEEDFKDSPFTLYLSDVEAGTNLKDVPPYDMLDNDEEQVLLTMFTAGEFPGFVKEKSSHPASYHLAEFTSDKIADLYDAVDKDLDKLMVKISADRFKEQLKMNAVSHGYITFVSQNGKDVTIHQGDKHHDFDWGWVSDTLGYLRKEEVVPPVEKKKGLFSRSSTREKHVPPSNNVVAAGADKVPKTETAIPKTTATGSNNPQPEAKIKPVVLTVENITVKKFKVPQHLSRRLKKGYLKDRLGHIPPTYDNPDQLYEMYTNPAGAILTKKEVEKALGMSAAKLPTLDNPKASGKQDDIAAEHIDTDRPIANPLPMLSKNGRERQHRFISDERIKKIISENSELITDPDKVQNREAKIPLFHAQLGMSDMAEYDALPFVELERMGRIDIHDLAVAAWTWKVRALSAELKVGKKKVEHVAQEEAPPKKQGLFSRRNAA